MKEKSKNAIRVLLLGIIILLASTFQWHAIEVSSDGIILTRYIVWGLINDDTLFIPKSDINSISIGEYSQRSKGSYITMYYAAIDLRNGQQHNIPKALIRTENRNKINNVIDQMKTALTDSSYARYRPWFVPGILLGSVFIGMCAIIAILTALRVKDPFEEKYELE